MDDVSEDGRQSLADLVCAILQANPPLSKLDLNMFSFNKEPAVGVEGMLVSLANSDITTLAYFDVHHNTGWMSVPAIQETLQAIQDK